MTKDHKHKKNKKEEDAGRGARGRGSTRIVKIIASESDKARDERYTLIASQEE